jgi:hypothetical protein
MILDDGVTHGLYLRILPKGSRALPLPFPLNPSKQRPILESGCLPCTRNQPLHAACCFGLGEIGRNMAFLR